jgi:oligosaccharide repeat unit polymerase
MERVSGYPEILSQRDPEKEWYGFRHGVLSHPYSFSYYLRHAFDRAPSPHYGMLIFGGPMELLGFHTRTPFENFDVDRNVESNVYSCFMPPIEDFGLWGGMLSFFVAGFLAGWAYLRVAQGRVLLIPILTMFYPHVLVIGGYFFSYNSMIMAHLIVGTYLFVYRRVIFAPQKTARPAVLAFNRS